MNNNELFIVLATFLGALGSGTTGWWDSHEPFDGRKFMGTAWRALVAALIAYKSFPLAADLTIWQAYITAFLVGAGIDVLGNRIQGGINKPTTEEKLAKVHADISQLTNEKIKETLSGKPG